MAKSLWEGGRLERSSKDNNPALPVESEQTLLWSWDGSFCCGIRIILCLLLSHDIECCVGSNRLLLLVISKLIDNEQENQIKSDFYYWKP